MWCWGGDGGGGGGVGGGGQVLMADLGFQLSAQNKRDHSSRRRLLFPECRPPPPPGRRESRPEHIAILKETPTPLDGLRPASCPTPAFPPPFPPSSLPYLAPFLTPFNPYSPFFDAFPFPNFSRFLVFFLTIFLS